MKTCLALTSLTAFSLLWLSSLQTATAAGLTPIPTSANTSAGSLISVAQVETATAVGTITSSGNAKVTLKSADIDDGTSLVFLVPVAKGDEKGYFRFGGSCCITLFERGRVRFADDLLEHGAVGLEVYARMGEAAAVAA